MPRTHQFDPVAGGPPPNRTRANIHSIVAANRGRPRRAARTGPKRKYQLNLKLSNIKRILFPPRKFPCLASLMLLTALQPAASAYEAKDKIILDTDIGDDIDDAWALAFVMSHQGFMPLGITIAHGNTPARARIPCKMLHLTGRDDIPVFVGRKTNDK